MTIANNKASVTNILVKMLKKNKIPKDKLHHHLHVITPYYSHSLMQSYITASLW